MRVGIVSALLLLAAAGFVAPALAAELSDGATCSTVRGDDALAACTRQVQRTDISKADLALAYYNRAAILLNKDNQTKDEFRQAIADFTAAIRIQPDLVAAYYWRGRVYKELGNEKEAAKDFAEADKLRPLCDTNPNLLCPPP